MSTDFLQQTQDTSFKIKCNSQQSRTTVQECKSEAGPPVYNRRRHLDCQAGAHASSAKPVQVGTGYTNEQDVRSFSNITSCRNHFLLFVKHLPMRILTGKYRTKPRLVA
jgi:hypothetical protein